MSTLYVDNLQPNLGSQVEIPNLKPLAGSVVQVKYFSDDTPAAFSGTVYTDALTVTFTPTSANNKVLLFAKATATSLNGGYDWAFRLVRDGSAIGGNLDPNNYTAASNILASSGMQSGESPETRNGEYLDSPATTSAITYKIQVIGGEGVTYYINRANATSSTAYWSAAGDTTLTIMEIAQ